MKETNNYLFPGIKKVVELEYDWGSYEEVFLFSSIEDFEKVKDYYELDLQLNNQNIGQGGTLEYSFEHDEKEVSLYIFNCKSESEYEDFRSWVASDNLEKLEKENPSILGGLFYHED
ncbi:MAG: hypothetical protein NE327_16160 [Lentisphaeraceae bacterium]|nr:hypothetical protein [Lentisphaeraceae bacterium]